MRYFENHLADRGQLWYIFCTFLASFELNLFFSPDFPFKDQHCSIVSFPSVLVRLLQKFYEKEATEKHKSLLSKFINEETEVNDNVEAELGRLHQELEAQKDLIKELTMSIKEQNDMMMKKGKNRSNQAVGEPGTALNLSSMNAIGTQDQT